MLVFSRLLLLSFAETADDCAIRLPIFYVLDSLFGRDNFSRFFFSGSNVCVGATAVHEVKLEQGKH